MEIIALILIWLGVIFCVLGVVGVMRFKDVLSRSHAIGALSTLGLGAIAVGTAILLPSALPELLALGAFVLLTSPVGTHAIALAAQQENRSRNQSAD